MAMEKRFVTVFLIFISLVLVLSGCAQRECSYGETKDCGAGIGICKAGVMSCDKNGMWGPCLDDEGQEVKAAGGNELCDNNLDDNCNGLVDENCGKCTDKDKDGFFNYNKESCPEGLDCDDSNNKVYPKAREVCINEIDDDCDGETDEGCNCADEDKDGYPLYNSVLCQTGTDCDDKRSAINPGKKEICNNMLDDDCDASTKDECECIDSDINLEPYYIKGTCSVDSSMFTDKCRDNSKVEEYSCENKVCKATLVTCPTSCIDGKCIKEEFDLRIKTDTKGQPAGTDDIIIRVAAKNGKFDSLGLFKGIAEKDELLYGKGKEELGNLGIDKKTFYDLTIKSPLSNGVYDKVVFSVPNVQNGTPLTAIEKLSYSSYSVRITSEDVSDASKDQERALVIQKGNVQVIEISSEGEQKSLGATEKKEGLLLPDGTKTGTVWIAKGLVDKGENNYDIFYYNNFERDERYYGSVGGSKKGEKIVSVNYGKTTGEVITIVTEGLKETYS